MANRTVKDAITIKGTNPQYLIEKIVRSRIYDCRYWKEDCFALTAELMVDKAMELKYVGGVFGGNIKPTPFLCLILKMLQIQPEKDIIVEFIRNGDFKYVRYLGAFYMRLTGTALDIYKYLEPLYIDYRKMKRLNRQGKFEMMHMDELIDELLHNERVLDISLPRLQKRHVLEDLNQLEIRISPLEENLDEIDSTDEDSDENDEKSNKRVKSRNSRSPSADGRNEGRSSSKHQSKHGRSRYTDYDRPERESPDYRRDPSPKSRTASRKHRSRSKSAERRREKRRSSAKHRHRSHSGDDDGRRSKHEKKHKRSRSRDRQRDKSRDKKDDKRR